MLNPPSAAGLTNALRRVVIVGEREALSAQSGDVFGRGIAEESGVFPAELRGAHVANTVARATRVNALKEHQPPSLVQPEYFLILERAHRGHRFEVLVK